MMRLGLEAVLRIKLNTLFYNAVNGVNDYKFILYIIFSTIFSEYLAEITLLIAIFKRHNIWLERLNLFPLGLPDGVEPPQHEELLAQLKEEFKQTGFNEELLDESDIMSLAKARNLIPSDEDNFFFSDTDSVKQS